MKKQLNKNASLFLIFALVIIINISTISVSAATVWPSFSTSKPIKCYTISNRNNTTAYTNSNLNVKKGTIWASDELWIYKISKNSTGKWYAYCSYPVSSGRKYAYIPLSAITRATSPSSGNTATKFVTSYRRPNGSKAGSISKGDYVYKLGTSNGYTQVLYNIGSTSSPSAWRMAWIKDSDYNNLRKVNTPSSSGFSPKGCIDSAKALSSPGSFYISGWVFDADTTQSCDLHFYINGPAGSGAKGYSITCTKSRPDVKRAFPQYNISNNTGFEKTYTIQGLSGKVTLYFYGINKSGGGENVYLGSNTIYVKDAASNSNTSSQTAKYAAYNGINYTSTLKKALSYGKISSTEYKNRISVLNEAQKMVTVIWKAPVSFHTWKGTSGSYNSNKAMQYSGKPSSAYQFVKDCSYVGIPYAANAGYNNYNTEEWLSLISTNGITSSTLEGTVTYIGKTRYNTTFRGIDCSGFVHKSYSTIGSYTLKDSNRLSCSGMINSSLWKKINPSEALPGDVLLKSGHVMIFLGKDSNGKVAVFESVADGTNGASGCRYYEFNSVSQYGYYRYSGIAR